MHCDGSPKNSPAKDLSEQAVFPSRIFFKLSQYDVSEEIGTGVTTNLFNVLTYIM